MKRLISLDVFRGITIAGMILVNNFESNGYTILDHAQWNGWTFADIIFSFFLWAVGMSLVFSLKNRLERGYTQKQIFFQILRRSLILFIIGVFLYNFPNFPLDSIRIPGVLQRIALCYFIVSMIFLRMSLKTQCIVILTILIGYWMALKLIPVPGFGAGVLAQNGNIVQYVDVKILNGHLYSEAWDPEGIVSTIPTVATTLIGTVTVGIVLTIPSGSHA